MTDTLERDEIKALEEAEKLINNNPTNLEDDEEETEGIDSPDEYFGDEDDAPEEVVAPVVVKQKTFSQAAERGCVQVTISELCDVFVKKEKAALWEKKGSELLVQYKQLFAAEMKARDAVKSWKERTGYWRKSQRKYNEAEKKLLKDAKSKAAKEAAVLLQDPEIAAFIEKRKVELIKAKEDKVAETVAAIEKSKAKIAERFDAAKEAKIAANSKTPKVAVVKKQMKGSEKLHQGAPKKK